MANSEHRFSDTSIIEFDLEPSFLDTKIVTCIGIKQSINSIVVEVNKELILQTIYLESFSDSTIKPLKNQLSKLLIVLSKEERSKIINSIVTCINRNVDVVSEISMQSSHTRSNNNEEGNKVDELIKLVLKSENIEELFINQYGKPFAAVRIGKNGYLEILSMSSTKFKRYLTRLYRENTHKSISDGSLNTVITTLASEAEFSGGIIPLYLRVSWGSDTHNSKKDCIYYDLYDTQGNIIEISKEGCRLINGGDRDVPILFIRYNQQPQVIPDWNYPDDIFEKLLNLTNVKKPHQRHLVKVYIISILIPDIDHVILTTYGASGAAKSFLLELIKKLIDPTKPTLLTLHRNIDQFIQQVNHNYVNYYDNVKFIPYWLSDEICKAVTGGGHTKRQLYTDDEDIIYEHKRPLGLNGINIALTESDALSRSLFIELEEIDEDRRRKEEDLWNEFERIRPQVFGYILDIIAKALKIKSNLRLERLPRMADFAVWGEAISQAMSYPPNSFSEVYAENRNEQNIIAINENRVGSLLLKYIQYLEEQLGSLNNIHFEPQSLYKELIDFAEANEIGIGDRQFPKNAATLVKKIKTIIPNLKAAYGIIVKIGRNTKDNTSVITICRKESELVTNDRTPSGGTESSEVIDSISHIQESSENSNPGINVITNFDDSTDNDVDRNIGDRNDH